MDNYYDEDWDFDGGLELDVSNHKKADKVKWIIVLIVGVLLVAAITVLAVQLNRLVITKTLGDSAYAEGVISEETGKAEAELGSLYTKEFVTTEGLKCEIADDATVEYKIFYYDENKKYLSASEAYSANFDSTSIPEGAKYCRIMITPLADEDGKIGFFEKGKYVEQVEVTVYKDKK